MNKNCHFRSKINVVFPGKNTKVLHQNFNLNKHQVNMTAIPIESIDNRELNLPNFTYLNNPEIK